MKAIIVANFFEDNDASRPMVMYRYLKGKGLDVKVYYCRFSHSLKKERVIEGEDFIPVDSISYKSNISIARIKSHLRFATNAFKAVEQLDFDLLYINLPPNALGIPFLKLKEKKGFKLWTDILDLWPEAFPFSKLVKKVFLLTAGKVIKSNREKVMKKSDLIITESNYFAQNLNLDTYPNSQVVYLKKRLTSDITFSELTKELTIGYLGNIGNIYDFESLIHIVSKVQKKRPVLVKIVGGGDLKEWLFGRLKDENINFEYFGSTFDESKKSSILSSCWFGYNGFKSNTEVALSYKTVDYFSYGIPILNSAKGDTKLLVNKYKLGANFTSDNLNDVGEFLENCTREDIINLKINVNTVFEEYFSEASFKREMDSHLTQILQNK